MPIIKKNKVMYRVSHVKNPILSSNKSNSIAQINCTNICGATFGFYPVCAVSSQAFKSSIHNNT